MPRYRVGIVGCGRFDANATPFVDGRRDKRFGIAYCHGYGYDLHPDTEIVAAATRDAERLVFFCDYFGVPGRYTDFRAMLAAEDLDLVSVCTWPQPQPEIVVAAAAAGVKGVLCEKPMALTLAECDAMVAACRRSGTRLSVDHQRRLGGPFRTAKEIARGGDIGELIRIEAYTGDTNLFTWGTHWADMLFSYLDEAPAEWVAAQVETRGGATTMWGQRCDDQAFVHVQYRDGVRGYIELGLPGWGRTFDALDGTARFLEMGQPGFAGAVNRLIGTEGMVEVLQFDPARPFEARVRARTKGRADWVMCTTSDSIHDSRHYLFAVEDLCRAIEQGREPELSGDRGRAAHEVVFAAFESALRGGRVDLPLAVADDRLLDALVRQQAGSGTSRRADGRSTGVGADGGDQTSV